MTWSKVLFFHDEKGREEGHFAGSNSIFSSVVCFAGPFGH